MQIFCLQWNLSANFSNNPYRYFNTSLKNILLLKNQELDKACKNYKIMTLTIQNKIKIKTKKQKDFIHQMDNYDPYVHNKDKNR